MNTEIELLIDKAKRSIRAARELFDADYYDFAVSRAYYALFYLCEALLLTKGKSYSKHSAVISAVYDEFVKTGELTNEFHKLLHRAFSLRQQSDYLSSSQITEEVASALIDEIELQVDGVLKKNTTSLYRDITICMLKPR